MTPALIASLTLSLQASAADGELRARLEGALVDHARALAADDACDLFSPARRAALEAGLRQIRDDLEIRGSDPAILTEAVSRAAGTRSLLDCASPGVQQIQAAVEARLGAYDAINALDFQGRRRSWRAQRVLPSEFGWPVVQAFGPVRFGWRRAPSGEGVVLSAAGRPAPAAAVIVMRDAAHAPAPVDATAGGVLQVSGDPLSAWGPPGEARMRIWSTGRVSPLESEDDNASTRENAYAFAFPQNTLARLSNLAPREGVRIELKNRQGATQQVIWIEVGALRAALDFVTAER